MFFIRSLLYFCYLMPKILEQDDNPKVHDRPSLVLELVVIVADCFGVE